MKGIGMKMFSGYSVAAAMLAAATLAGCPTVPELHTQELTGSNELNGKQVYFIPVDDAKRAGYGDYARFVNAQEGLTVSADDHAAIELDTVVELGEPLLFFGEFYNNIVVSANGTVVLSNDANAAAGKNANLTEHFQSRQVSVLPVDATLQAGADVLFFQDGDQVVVTFEGVTVGDQTDNSFQVVFVKSRGVDGDLVLSYAKVNPTGTTGVAGLSDAPLEGATEAEISDFLGRFGAGNNIGANANTASAS